MTRTISRVRALMQDPCAAGRKKEALHRAAAFVMLVCTLAGIGAANTAFAHGFAGKRFFPATLAIEDPFVADELALPTFSKRKMPASGDEPATVESEYSFEFAKRITPNFGISLEAPYLRLKPEEGERRNGFDNLGLGLKYQFLKSEAHETILSVGLDWDIGGSGSKRVDAESFSTFTPAFFFGKGFGDLPDNLKYLRPFALTGLAGVSIPTRSGTSRINDDGDVEIERHPNVLTWGFSVQYSVPYLQSFVKDVGLQQPFSRMIPVVEFAFETPLNRGGGATTGTVNPGVLWVGRKVQLGLEAVIPVNDHTGNKVGFRAQLHFFLDDIFPTTIGRPIFGNRT